MTQVEFKTQIERLNASHRNFYSTEKAKMVAEIVMALPVDYFAKCIDRGIWADHAPKLDWFKKIKSEFYQGQAPAYLSRDYDHDKMPPSRVHELINNILRRKQRL